MAYDQANQQGVIVVWPQGAGLAWDAIGGVAASWNGDGACCGPQAVQDVDDVGFVKQIIENTVAAESVDTTKIYMTGHSMGCMLAQRFLTVHSSLIAAMTCSSHVLGLNTPPASSAVTATSVMLIQGFVDTDTLFAGRSGTAPSDVSAVGIPWGPGFPYVQISSYESITSLAGMMGCTGSTYNLSAVTPTVEGLTIYSATGCNADVTVELFVLPNCGHEAYLDMAVSTAGDVTAGVQPCKFDTATHQYSFLSGKSGPVPTMAGTVAVETTYPSSGSGGAVGAIIGGTFVPFLMAVLWMSGAFAKYGWPSPFVKKAPADVTITGAEAAKEVTEAAPAAERA